MSNDLTDLIVKHSLEVSVSDQMDFFFLLGWTTVLSDKSRIKVVPDPNQGPHLSAECSKGQLAY